MNETQKVLLGLFVWFIACAYLTAAAILITLV